MSPFITHSAKLIPYAKRPKSVPSFVTAYEYEPSADEPHARHGKLFAVIEVLASGRIAQEVVDLVIESAGTHYYNDPTEYSSPLERFEQAIKNLNSDLAAYINDGNSAWIGKMSAVLAVLVDDTLHVTQTGSAEAFLYRGNKSVHIASGSSAVHQANKTFVAIASGELEVADRFIMTTPALIHQFSSVELTSIISSSSPNAAIAKLHDRLSGASQLDRVGAIIVELTTPELAALQVRDMAPDEIHIGAPESIMDAAKVAATPIANSAIASGKRIHSSTKQSVNKAKPYARSIALRIVKILRTFLTGRGAGRRIGIAVALVSTLLALAIWNHSQAVAMHNLTTRYFNDCRALVDARQNNSNKESSRASLEKAASDVTLLAKDPHHRAIDRTVRTQALKSGVPGNLADLASAIQGQLDSLDGLTRVQSTVVSDLSGIKNARLTRFEKLGTKAIVFDSANNNAIYIIDLTNGSRRVSSAATSELGKVVSTAVSSAGDGVYILTDAPGVWLYKPGDDSLTKQSTGVIPWPKANALASYAGNLYLLGDSIIYKSMPTIGGFTAKATYLSQTQAPAIGNATAIDVDGSVFVTGPNGLSRFLAGSLIQTLAIPESLQQATSLRGAQAAGLICLINPSTSRIGQISFVGDQMAYRAQYSLSGYSKVSDATCDGGGNSALALADGKLVKFALLPQ